MEKISVRLVGSSPLMMHSDRLANPLDPLKKEIAKYTSKRKKTDDDHAEIARLEWLAAMHFDEKKGPVLPGIMLKATMINAAKKTREAPKIKSGVMILTNKAAVQYTGPRDQKKMWKSGKFADVRSVVVQRARLMRCRPIFHDWSAEFDIVYDKSVIDTDDILRIIETGGVMIGIGEYRPANGGDFGRFTVEEAN